MSAHYSRQQGYVFARHQTNRPTLRLVKRRVKFGPTTAKYLGLSILAILAVIMLAQSSTSSTSAYKQSDIRNKISQVNQDVQRLQLEARRAQSLSSIQNTPVKDQMQQTTSVDGYIQTGDVAGVSTTKP